MLNKIFKNKKKGNIDPDEIFLDSSNIPSYNKDQFEGRLEKPISVVSLFMISFLFVVLVIGFSIRVVKLQIVEGKDYLKISNQNTLRKDIIFSDRGIIMDRNSKELAWNEYVTGEDFPRRRYLDLEGLSNLLGHIKYPKKDTSGFFYSLETSGGDGIEKYFNEKLVGKNGVKLTEVDVQGNIHSESAVIAPIHGEELHLSIDADVQDRLSHFLARAVNESGFQGGAGVIMNSQTGEILSIVTYPQYDSEVMTEGKDSSIISKYFTNQQKPFLDRAISGLYAPGSIVKPFIALGALNEKIISPEKKIESKGFITVPNPYDPSKPSIFKDWKVNGWTNVQEALAVSSDVYFYAVGGGYKDQKGLGISKIDEYLGKFLFGVKTTNFFEGPSGNIPTPEWKEKTFNGEKWVLGNTYHTSIGQYGFQVTPVQVVRALTGIVNNGKIVSPVILKDQKGDISLISGIEDKNYEEVKKGMRLAVTNGTAIALNVAGTSAGAKTGTAEVGVRKDRINSWVEGFFPFENPKYVFTVVLESGPTSYKISAMQVMGSVITWIRDNRPEYLGKEMIENIIPE